MIKPRVAVIGAGITGLAAAHRLIESGGVDVHVFDANGRPGGLLTTQRRGDYLIEHGADSFITNKPAALDLCIRLGLESELIRTNNDFRRSLVLHNGKPVAVPRGFQLLMPTDAEAIQASSLLSESGKQRVAKERDVPPRTELADESVASFVKRRFGEELFDRLAQPMVGGIYTADPERLSLLATLPRFLQMEVDHGSLTAAAEATEQQESSGARYGLFVSLRNGVQQMVESLRERIERSHTIQCDTTVLSVEKVGSKFNIECTGGAQEFDAVVVTTSAWRAAELLGQKDELTGLLQQIEYTSSAVVCSAHRLSDIEHAMDAFGLVIPSVENRRILAVSFASRKFADRAPDDCVLLRTFVGGAMQPEILEYSDAEISGIVQSELSEIFGVRAEPEFSLVTRYDRAMPQYHLGHVERVRAIRKMVAAVSGLELAGNAYEGVGIPDSIRSGEEAAERLFDV